MPVRSRHERGYGSKWVVLRARALRRDGYLCVPCLKEGRPTPATEVDHITPKMTGGLDTLENTQSICSVCHHAKTVRETYSRNQVRFDIFGNPVWIPDNAT